MKTQDRIQEFEAKCGILRKVYVRGKPRGFLAACHETENVDSPVHFGYSMCSKEDTYSKKLGKMIAINRALDKVAIEIPQSYKSAFWEFRKRAEAYFKMKFREV